LKVFYSINKNLRSLNYSLITAARNEEKYISKTLESVVKQTVLPGEWVIINDGSTDKTADLISLYTVKYSWIKLINLFDFKPELKSTGGRIGHILNIAAKSLKHDYDFITKLDADIEFESSFFEQLLSEFKKDDQLGIASGHLVFEGRKEILDYANSTPRGATLLIRKEVFKKVNGFYESNGSGEDTLFCVAARYYGWKTTMFPVFFNHLKPEGIKNSRFYHSYIKGFYKGSIPYRLDYFLFTQAKHLFEKPFLIGSIIQVVIYLNTRYIIRYRPFPALVKEQLFKEQLEYIRLILKRKF
jgi:poly-beta-1,6-N-acetyl-D-glucosamine synthase